MLMSTYRNAGTADRYYIFTPTKALLGCASLFVRPALCTGADTDLTRNVTYGAYRDDNTLQWTLENVPGQSAMTFRVTAQVGAEYPSEVSCLHRSCTVPLHIDSPSCIISTSLLQVRTVTRYI